ncbi:hypothetical protein V7654_01150 [Bacillus sp. JJ1609]|uniref:hypothetical protein n=1 Tax=Bacillus sp. JJ1609 TaxID=3122977 RepID=UPI002FFF5247
MKNTKNIMPPFLREVCSAVCAIVHANINESQYFKQSGFKKRTRLSSKLRKNVLSDHGVIVEIEQEIINVKIYVSARIGASTIFHDALELQHKITEEILLLTSFKVQRVDIIITGIHQM